MCLRTTPHGGNIPLDDNSHKYYIALVKAFTIIKDLYPFYIILYIDK